MEGAASKNLHPTRLVVPGTRKEPSAPLSQSLQSPQPAESSPGDPSIVLRLTDASFASLKASVLYVFMSATSMAENSFDDLDKS